VQAYATGPDFLKEVDTDGYGCILLDASMPEMSGLEIHTRLNQQKCVIPIIFITGDADIPTLVDAVNDDTVSFLQKPFRVDALLEHITLALTKEKRRCQRTDTNSGTIEKSPKQVQGKATSARLD